MISSYGDQSTTEINPSYYYRASQRCLNCSGHFQRHLMFYTCNYNIRVTHKMVLISIFFLHESDPRRDHQQIVLYSFLSLHALALHLAVKILLQIFLYEDLSVIATYICRLYFPPEIPAGPHFVTQPILLSENIPNI